MATVSWGAPDLEFIKLGTGVDPSQQTAWVNEGVGQNSYVLIKGDILLEDSSQLNTTEGEEKTIKNEKGEDVDRKKMPASYAFTTSIIKKKGETVVATSFAPVNGVVPGDWAMRLRPEDPDTTGFAFMKCSISTTKGWNADQGSLDVLNVSGLLPDGNNKEICQDFVPGSTHPTPTPVNNS